MRNKDKIGVIILAAGSSSRLGQPKQLVEYKGKNLLQAIIDLADSLDFESKILVLGANAEDIKSNIKISNFELFQNKNWEEGMASSLRSGLGQLENNIDHVLILLSDQPLVTREHLLKLIRKQLEVKVPATFSKYEEKPGVPAIFSRSLFPKLMNLKGDEGAKKLLHDQGFRYECIDFEKGNFDVDTKEDVERLKELEQK